MSIGGQGHVLKRFDEDMRKLQKRVLKMGNLVYEQINSLHQALQDSDEETVEQVIEADRSVDLLEVKVDKFIVRLLARRSPMGSDLRFIITASRIVTDLERLGDETTQMARVLISEYANLGLCKEREVLEEVRELLLLLEQLLSQAMRAFKHQDYAYAKALAEGRAGSDGELLQRVQALWECTHMSDGDVAHAVNLVLVLRSLERGLRYLQNIGEHVVFLVTGKDIRHKT